MSELLPRSRPAPFGSEADTAENGAVSKENRVEISWVRSLGSALGAVSSAVLLSTLGVGGTLIGAALGSLVITVGGAMYARSLQATKERVIRTAVRTDRSRLRAGRDPQDAPGEVSQENPPATLTEEDDPSAGERWKRMLCDLPWKRLIGGAAVVFVIAMALILAFELTTGRTVSSYTGGSSKTESGTSIPGFDGRSGSGTDNEQAPKPQDQIPQDERSPEETPTGDTPPKETSTGEAPKEPQPQEDAPQEQVPQEDEPVAPQEQAPRKPQPQQQAPQPQAPQPQQQAPQPQPRPQENLGG